MNTTFNKVVAIIVIVMVAIVAIPKLYEMVAGKQTTVSSTISVNLSGFTPESVNTVSIAKGGNETVLSYKNGTWFVGADEADTDKINQLFKALTNLKVKEMVSENQTNWSKFGVTKDTGYQVTLAGNGKDSVFLIGNTDSSATDFFIRKDGIQNTYLASGDLRNILGWSTDQWKKPADDKKGTSKNSDQTSGQAIQSN